jgi:DNA-binding LytR/AlgR family response regulator
MSKNRQRFWIKTVNGQYCLPITDICWVQATGDYCNLITADGEQHLWNGSLSSLIINENSPFVRCHRSYAVNWDKVTGFYRDSSNKWVVHVQQGKKEICVPVSNKYLKEIKSIVSNGREKHQEDS